MQLIPTHDQLDKKAKHISKVTTLTNATIMNIQLKMGETVAEHDSSKEVIIVVKRGAVLFTVEGVETLITPDEILHIAPFEKHSLRAQEDTDILVFQITP
jgi:quercetin dioxygenase-like cupin family protein